LAVDELPEFAVHPWILLAEELADGCADGAEVARARENRLEEGDSSPSACSLYAAQDTLSADAFAAALGAAYHGTQGFAMLSRESYFVGRRSEYLVQADLVRDIFGNPFRSVTFLAEWRTATAVGIAARMYESRDFSAMPILADALRDAGCENEDVLNHCRDTGARHVRGCWVVDLVLGKS
jgi:hypothetical protein